MGSVNPIEDDGGKIIGYDARASVYVDCKRRQPHQRFYLVDYTRRTPAATEKAAERAAEEWIADTESDSRRGRYVPPAGTQTVLEVGPGVAGPATRCRVHTEGAAGHG